MRIGGRLPRGLLYAESRSLPASVSATAAQAQLCIVSIAAGGLDRPAEDAGERDPEGRLRASPPPPVSPAPRRVQDLSNAGRTLAATSSWVSAPGTSTWPCTSDQPSTSTPSRSPNSSRVSPVRSPRSYSRSRASSTAVQAGLLLQERRRLARTREVAAHEQRGSQLGHHRGHRLGLRAADVVQTDVGVPLGPALGVPGGAAVPRPGGAATPTRRGGPQRPRPELTSAGIAITGQSRQSRSRA